MRLADQIEIVAGETVNNPRMGNTYIDWTNPTVVATVAAHVTYRSTALSDPFGGAYTLSEELTAITPPVVFDPEAHRVRWRGNLYDVNGLPLVRMRGGTVHHLTIPMKRTV